jgi:hypothetical protein
MLAGPSHRVTDVRPDTWAAKVQAVSSCFRILTSGSESLAYPVGHRPQERLGQIARQIHHGFEFPAIQGRRMALYRSSCPSADRSKSIGN